MNDDILSISELKVMRSAAGYYLGHSCITADMPEMPQPYDRVSGYYRTAAEAEKELAAGIASELE